jgi:uncharacterized protein YcbX
VQLPAASVSRAGIAGDRAFAVLDPQGRLVNGKRLGPMVLIQPRFDPLACTLELGFPGGQVVSGVVELGPRYVAPFGSRPRAVRPVRGPWSEAISRWARQPLELVSLDEAGDGADRGPSVSLLSTAALSELAKAGGVDGPLDARRFRMTFGIDGVSAYTEDGWVGREVRIGEAVVRVLGNVGRCAVTTQDPDTGHPTVDTLRILHDTRGSLETTEPLPFGVWAEVLIEGLVRIGDRVVATSA